MKVKAILFDLDGVLLDTEKIYHKYWKQAAAEFGYDLADEIFLQLRSCDSSIARRIVDTAAGVDGAYDRIRERRKELMKDSAQKDGFELKDGVIEFLSAIRDLPVRKAIVTASSLEKKRAVLADLGIADYFDEIISVKEVPRGKPFPDVYLFACEKLGLRPEECLAIEDSPNGIRSAYRAGTRVVMVPDLTGREPYWGRCEYHLTEEFTMGTDNRDIVSEVEAVLDEFVRPYLAAHGGDLKVVGVEGGVVFFHLMGRCVGCAAADQTSEELINRQLVERVPGIKKAVLANGISPELLEQTLALLRAHPSF